MSCSWWAALLGDLRWASRCVKAVIRRRYVFFHFWQIATVCRLQNTGVNATSQPPPIDAHTVEELVRKCIMSAVLNFSLSEFLYSTTESARNSIARQSAEFRNLNFLNEHYPPPPLHHQPMLNHYAEDPNAPPNILQLRVIKAQDLGLKQGGKQNIKLILMNSKYWFNIKFILIEY